MPVNPIISHRLKCNYIMIPKCATISTRALLAENLGIEYVNYKSFQDLKKIRYYNIHRYNDYFKFTFVRHPISRFISCYFDKVLGQPGDQTYKPLYCPDMTIKDFLNYVLTTPDDSIDWHVRPQYWYLNKCSIDFIGTLDNYDRDIETVKEKLNLKGDARQLRPTDHKQFKHYLSSRDISNLEKRYRQDFELYNKYRG